MPLAEGQLGQLRPGDTTAATVYTLDSTRAIIERIYIHNSSAGDADFSLFNDDDGAVYDNDSQIFGPVTLAPGQTWNPPIGILMGTTAGTIGVKTSVADALNFIAYGTRVSE